MCKITIQIQASPVSSQQKDPQKPALETGNPDVVEEALDSAENVGVIALESLMRSAKTPRKGILYEYTGK